MGTNVFLLVTGAVFAALFSFALTRTDSKTSQGSKQVGLIVIGGFALGVLTVVLNTRSQSQSDAEALARHDQLLRSVLGESQRVSPSDVRLVIRYGFYDYVHSDEGPTFLDDRLEAIVQVKKSSPVPPEQRNEWSCSPVIAEPDVTLRPVSRVATPIMQFTSQGQHIRGTQLVFSDFVGDLNTFAAAAKWNGASIEMHLSALEQDRQLREWAQSSFGDSRPASGSAQAYGTGWDLFQDIYKSPVPASGEPGYLGQLYITPVRVTADLFVGSRKVASSTGVLVAADVGGDLNGAFIKFSIVDVDKNLFMDFSVGPTQTRTGDRISLGISIVCILACAAISWFVFFGK